MMYTLEQVSIFLCNRILRPLSHSTVQSPMVTESFSSSVLTILFWISSFSEVRRSKLRVIRAKAVGLKMAFLANFPLSNSNLFPLSFNVELEFAVSNLKKSSMAPVSTLPHFKAESRTRRRQRGFNPDGPLSNSRTNKFSLLVSQFPTHRNRSDWNPPASSIDTTRVVEEAEVEIAEGYTITQFCDKMIDVFLNDKPRPKDWRKLLVFREEWNKYKESFYNRCRGRTETENDPAMKQKLISLARKVKKIDDEIERHTELLKEVQQSPTDINAVVARRRKDFTGEFFRHLALLSEIYDNLEDRDAMARLGAKCLSAVCAYDSTVENMESLDAAQAKLDDILSSPSLDVACEKIKSMAKAKELDSSLILLINSAWASAKESPSMKNEVKDIMYQLYQATKSSLRSIAPKEIKLLKHLLNVIDPEERFSALATAFSPGDEHDAKDPNALYTTPKELHKWIMIMLDAYHLNNEETDIWEAKQMTQPVVIQRLFILKETIEEEYLNRKAGMEEDTESKK